MNFPSLVIFALVCFLEEQAYGHSTGRVKRVVFGDLMADNQVYHYKAFEYFVWIGRTWTCSEVTAWWNLWGRLPPDTNAREIITRLNKGHHHIHCGEDPAHFKCGGTLLSPRLIHSACHCFVKPILVDKRYLVSRVTLAKKWEEYYQVFMGSTDIADMYYPIETKKVEIDPQCGKVSFAPGYMIHDFAWILLSKNVPDGTGVVTGAWGKQLDYAGPYKIFDVLENHERILREQQTCMIMGFGLDVELSQKERGSARKLRHGYVQIMNWWQCFHWLVTTFQHGPIMNHNFLDWYNDTLDSWACAAPLPKSKQHTGKGDSGGPVTCSGQYFALNSFYINFQDLDDERWKNYSVRGRGLLDVYAAIKFDLQAVTLEFRGAFESKMFYVTTVIEDLAEIIVRKLRVNPLAHVKEISDVTVTSDRNSASVLLTTLGLTGTVAIFMRIAAQMN